MVTTIDFITRALSVLSMVYTVSGLNLLSGKKAGRCMDDWDMSLSNYLWIWLKYPALVYVVLFPVSEILSNGHLVFWDYLIIAGNLVIWLWVKDAGDDDWKKRLKKRLTETVKTLGSRLIVVPQGA